jgi:hypothetical protein
MNKTSLLLAVLVATFHLNATAQTEDKVQWGSSAKPAVAREAAEGMGGYYEPDKIEQKGGAHAFTLYRTSTPSPSDEMGRYMINCETREFVSTIKGQTTQPSRILAGESIYTVGKKLCGWDQKGIFKKVFEAAGG